jgi:hypothetical protein
MRACFLHDVCIFFLRRPLPFCMRACFLHDVCIFFLRRPIIFFLLHSISDVHLPLFLHPFFNLGRTNHFAFIVGRSTQPHTPSTRRTDLRAATARASRCRHTSSAPRGVTPVAQVGLVTLQWRWRRRRVHLGDSCALVAPKAPLHLMLDNEGGRRKGRRPRAGTASIFITAQE